MSSQPYIKITVTRIDDGSLYYHNLKNYEKIKTYIAVYASISGNELRFASSGRKYMVELDKYDVKLEPIF